MYRYNLLLCIRIPYTRRHSTTDDPSFFIHFETILYIPPLTPPPFEKNPQSALATFPAVSATFVLLLQYYLLKGTKYEILHYSMLSVLIQLPL